MRNSEYFYLFQASECLDTSPYTDPVDMVSITNTSVTVRLHPVSWPDACENISQPSIRYTVYYRKLDDMNPTDHCGPAGQQCFAKVCHSLTLFESKPLDKNA